MTAPLSTAGRWALPALLGGLLACQPTPTEHELLRLRLLDDELMAINDKVGKANSGSVKSIQAQVEKNHNQPGDVAVLTKAQAVRAETQQLVAYLRGLRHTLTSVEAAPSVDQLADRRTVAAALLSSGRADSLQGRLSRYSAHLRPYLKLRTELLPSTDWADEQGPALAAAPLPGQRFADFYFRDATTGEALAALAQQEAHVLRLESEALSNLSLTVGSSNLTFDTIGAYASAESSTVAEGQTYRAEMFLTASASALKARMTLNGQPLQVGPDGKGQVVFTAPPLPPGQNRRTAYWAGSVAIRYHGRDTTFRVKVPYTILRRR